MLKGIDPLLTPDLLQSLCAMGHGDTIAIVDAHFPAAAMGPPVLRLAGATAPRATDAILSVLPLDDFAMCMQRPGLRAETDRLPVVQELRAVVCKYEGAGFEVNGLERFGFYEAAENAFCIVATGETRQYGNLLLKKGVVKAA